MNKTRRRWNAPALLIGAVVVLAAPQHAAANDFEYLAARNLARAEAVYESLVTAPGPRPSAPGRDNGKTCEQLWNERLALQGSTFHYQPPLTDDPRLWIAKAVSTVFFPALIYVGVATAVRLEENTTRFRARERIDELARASAELRCFDRS
jgi:hypothetical protein